MDCVPGFRGFFSPLFQFNEIGMDLRKCYCGKLKGFQNSYPFLLIFIGSTFKDGVLDSDKQDGNSFFLRHNGLTSTWRKHYISVRALHPNVSTLDYGHLFM